MPKFEGVLHCLDVEKFVQNVKFRCEVLDIKPTNACKESGVGSSFLSNIKRGQIPSVANVQRLAEYLGLTTSELLGESKSDSAADPGIEEAPSPENWARAFSELSTEELMQVQEILLKEFGVRIKGPLAE